MTTTDLTAVVLDAIVSVAPDVDVRGLDPDADLVDELGLDSMDFLNIVVAVHKATGIEIPERDYPQCRTLAGFTAELARRGGP